MFDYARCVVRQKRMAVEAYLKAPTDSPKSRQILSRITITECLGAGELRFNAVVFRAGLYNALYAIDFSRSAPDISKAPFILYNRLEVKEGAYTAANWWDMEELSDCAVRKAPEKARILVMTRVGTPDEKAAFQDMTAAYSACLHQDQRVAFSPIMLRGYVGEVLYRLSLASQDSHTALSAGEAR